MPDFQTLQGKYGDVVAHAILIDMERHLRLNSTQLAVVDPAIRFQSVMELMGDAPMKQAA